MSVVALESFVDAETGEQYWAGISHVNDATHEVVRRNPAKFGPKASKVDTAGYDAHHPRSQRSRAAAAGRTRSKAAPPARAAREFQRGYLPSPFSVVLTDRGKAQLDAVEWSEYRERAGGLFGWVERKTIFVDSVEMNPVDEVGHRYAASIDTAHMRALEANDLIGREWIGDLHSHITFDGEEPSEQDMRGWASFRRTEHELWVGMLASPGTRRTDDPWALPPFHNPHVGVWVARTSETGTVVVEPAQFRADERPLWAR